MQNSTSPLPFFEPVDADDDIQLQTNAVLSNNVNEDLIKPGVASMHYVAGNLKPVVGSTGLSGLGLRINENTEQWQRRKKLGERNYVGYSAPKSQSQSLVLDPSARMRAVAKLASTDPGSAALSALSRQKDELELRNALESLARGVAQIRETVEADVDVICGPMDIQSLLGVGGSFADAQYDVRRHARLLSLRTHPEGEDARGVDAGPPADLHEFRRHFEERWGVTAHPGRVGRVYLAAVAQRQLEAEMRQSAQAAPSRVVSVAPPLQSVRVRHCVQGRGSLWQSRATLRAEAAEDAADAEDAHTRVHALLSPSSSETGIAHTPASPPPHHRARPRSDTAVMPASPSFADLTAQGRTPPSTDCSEPLLAARLEQWEVSADAQRVAGSSAGACPWGVDLDAIVARLCAPAAPPQTPTPTPENVAADDDAEEGDTRACEQADDAYAHARFSAGAVGVDEAHAEDDVPPLPTPTPAPAAAVPVPVLQLPTTLPPLPPSPDALAQPETLAQLYQAADSLATERVHTAALTRGAAPRSRPLPQPSRSHSLAALPPLPPPPARPWVLASRGLMLAPAVWVRALHAFIDAAAPAPDALQAVPARAKDSDPAASTPADPALLAARARLRAALLAAHSPQLEHREDAPPATHFSVTLVDSPPSVPVVAYLPILAAATTLAQPFLRALREAFHDTLQAAAPSPAALALATHVPPMVTAPLLTVTLDGSPLNQPSVAALAGLLSNCFTWETHYGVRRPIPARAVYSVHGSVASIAPLLALSLRCCALTDAGLAHILRALLRRAPHSPSGYVAASLVELRIGNNYSDTWHNALSRSSARALAKFVSVSASLESLSVCRASAGFASVLIARAPWRSPTSQLAYLDLSHCSLSTASLVALFRSLTPGLPHPAHTHSPRTSFPVRALLLAGCDLSAPEAVQALCVMLATNSTLASLDISHCKLHASPIGPATPPLLSLLAYALASPRCRLTSLDLSGNPLGARGLWQLSHGLPYSRLTSLRLSGCAVEVNSPELPTHHADIPGSIVPPPLPRLPPLTPAQALAALQQPSLPLVDPPATQGSLADHLASLTAVAAARACFVRFAHALAHSPLLATLDLSHNTLGDDGVLLLSLALSTGWSNPVIAAAHAQRDLVLLLRACAASDGAEATRLCRRRASVLRRVPEESPILPPPGRDTTPVDASLFSVAGVELDTNLERAATLPSTGHLWALPPQPPMPALLQRLVQECVGAAPPAADERAGEVVSALELLGDRALGDGFGERMDWGVARRQVLGEDGSGDGSSSSNAFSTALVPRGQGAGEAGATSASAAGGTEALVYARVRTPPLAWAVRATTEAQEVAKASTRIPSGLLRLDLSHTYVTEGGAAWCTPLFFGNTSVQWLGLSGNFIPAASVKQWASAVTAKLTWAPAEPAARVHPIPPSAAERARMQQRREQMLSQLARKRRMLRGPSPAPTVAVPAGLRRGSASRASATAILGVDGELSAGEELASDEDEDADACADLLDHVFRGREHAAQGGAADAAAPAVPYPCVDALCYCIKRVVLADIAAPQPSVAPFQKTLSSLRVRVRSHSLALALALHAHRRRTRARAADSQHALAQVAGARASASAKPTEPGSRADSASAPRTVVAAESALAYPSPPPLPELPELERVAPRLGDTLLEQVKTSLRAAAGAPHALMPAQPQPPALASHGLGGDVAASASSPALSPTHLTQLVDALEQHCAHRDALRMLYVTQRHVLHAARREALIEVGLGLWCVERLHARRVRMEADVAMCEAALRADVMDVRTAEKEHEARVSVALERERAYAEAIRCDIARVYRAREDEERRHAQRVADLTATASRISAERDGVCALLRSALCERTALEEAVVDLYLCVAAAEPLALHPRFLALHTQLLPSPYVASASLLLHTHPTVAFRELCAAAHASMLAKSFPPLQTLPDTTAAQSSGLEDAAAPRLTRDAAKKAQAKQQTQPVPVSPLRAPWPVPPSQAAQCARAWAAALRTVGEAIAVAERQWQAECAQLVHAHAERVARVLVCLLTGDLFLHNLGGRGPSSPRSGDDGGLWSTRHGAGQKKPAGFDTHTPAANALPLARIGTLTVTDDAHTATIVASADRTRAQNGETSLGAVLLATPGSEWQPEPRAYAALLAREHAWEPSLAADSQDTAETVEALRAASPGDSRGSPRKAKRVAHGHVASARTLHVTVDSSAPTTASDGLAEVLDGLRVEPAVAKVLRVAVNAGRLDVLRTAGAAVMSIIDQVRATRQAMVDRCDAERMRVLAAQAAREDDRTEDTTSPRAREGDSAASPMASPASLGDMERAALAAMDSRGVCVVNLTRGSNAMAWAHYSAAMAQQASSFLWLPACAGVTLHCPLLHVPIVIPPLVLPPQPPAAASYVPALLQYVCNALAPALLASPLSSPADVFRCPLLPSMETHPRHVRDAVVAYRDVIARAAPVFTPSTASALPHFPPSLLPSAFMPLLQTPLSSTVTASLLLAPQLRLPLLSPLADLPYPMLLLLAKCMQHTHTHTPNVLQPSSPLLLPALALLARMGVDVPAAYVSPQLMRPRASFARVPRPAAREDSASTRATDRAPHVSAAPPPSLRGSQASDPLPMALRTLLQSFAPAPHTSQLSYVSHGAPAAPPPHTPVTAGLFAWLAELHQRRVSPGHVTRLAVDVLVDDAQLGGAEVLRALAGDDESDASDGSSDSDDDEHAATLVTDAAAGILRGASSLSSRPRTSVSALHPFPSSPRALASPGLSSPQLLSPAPTPAPPARAEDVDLDGFFIPGDVAQPSANAPRFPRSRSRRAASTLALAGAQRAPTGRTAVAASAGSNASGLPGYAPSADTREGVPCGAVMLEPWLTWGEVVAKHAVTSGGRLLVKFAARTRPADRAARELAKADAQDWKARVRAARAAGALPPQPPQPSAAGMGVGVDALAYQWMVVPPPSDDPAPAHVQALLPADAASAVAAPPGALSPGPGSPSSPTHARQHTAHNLAAIVAADPQVAAALAGARLDVAVPPPPLPPCLAGLSAPALSLLTALLRLAAMQASHQALHPHAASQPQPQQRSPPHAYSRHSSAAALPHAAAPGSAGASVGGLPASLHGVSMSSLSVATVAAVVATATALLTQSPLAPVHEPAAPVDPATGLAPHLMPRCGPEHAAPQSTPTRVASAARAADDTPRSRRQHADTNTATTSQDAESASVSPAAGSRSPSPSDAVTEEPVDVPAPPPSEDALVSVSALLSSAPNLTALSSSQLAAFHAHWRCFYAANSTHTSRALQHRLHAHRQALAQPAHHALAHALTTRKRQPLPVLSEAFLDAVVPRHAHLSLPPLLSSRAYAAMLAPLSAPLLPPAPVAATTIPVASQIARARAVTLPSPLSPLAQSRCVPAALATSPHVLPALAAAHDHYLSALALKEAAAERAQQRPGKEVPAASVSPWPTNPHLQPYVDAPPPPPVPALLPLFPSSGLSVSVVHHPLALALAQAPVREAFAQLLALLVKHDLLGDAHGSPSLTVRGPASSAWLMRLYCCLCTLLDAMVAATSLPITHTLFPLLRRALAVPHLAPRAPAMPGLAHAPLYIAAPPIAAVYYVPPDTPAACPPLTPLPASPTLLASPRPPLSLLLPPPSLALYAHLARRHAGLAALVSRLPLASATPLPPPALLATHPSLTSITDPAVALLALKSQLLVSAHPLAPPPLVAAGDVPIAINTPAPTPPVPAGGAAHVSPWTRVQGIDAHPLDTLLAAEVAEVFTAGNSAAGALASSGSAPLLSTSPPPGATAGPSPAAAPAKGALPTSPRRSGFSRPAAPPPVVYVLPTVVSVQGLVRTGLAASPMPFLLAAIAPLCTAPPSSTPSLAPLVLSLLASRDEWGLPRDAAGPHTRRARPALELQPPSGAVSDTGHAPEVDPAARARVALWRAYCMKVLPQRLQHITNTILVFPPDNSIAEATSALIAYSHAQPEQTQTQAGGAAAAPANSNTRAVEAAASKGDAARDAAAAPFQWPSACWSRGHTQALHTYLATQCLTPAETEAYLRVCDGTSATDPDAGGRDRMLDGSRAGGRPEEQRMDMALVRARQRRENRSRLGTGRAEQDAQLTATRTAATPGRDVGEGRKSTTNAAAASAGADKASAEDDSDSDADDSGDEATVLEIIRLKRHNHAYSDTECDSEEIEKDMETVVLALRKLKEKDGDEVDEEDDEDAPGGAVAELEACLATLERASKRRAKRKRRMLGELVSSSEEEDSSSDVDSTWSDDSGDSDDDSDGEVDLEHEQTRAAREAHRDKQLRKLERLGILRGLASLSEKERYLLLQQHEKSILAHGERARELLRRRIARIRNENLTRRQAAERRIEALRKQEEKQWRKRLRRLVAKDEKIISLHTARALNGGRDRRTASPTPRRSARQSARTDAMRANALRRRKERAERELLDRLTREQAAASLEEKKRILLANALRQHKQSLATARKEAEAAADALTSERGSTSPRAQRQTQVFRAAHAQAQERRVRRALLDKYLSHLGPSYMRPLARTLGLDEGGQRAPVVAAGSGAATAAEAFDMSQVFMPAGVRNSTGKHQQFLAMLRALYLDTRARQSKAGAGADAEGDETRIVRAIARLGTRTRSVDRSPSPRGEGHRWTQSERMVRTHDLWAAMRAAGLTAPPQAVLTQIARAVGGRWAAHLDTKRTHAQHVASSLVPSDAADGGMDLVDAPALDGEADLDSQAQFLLLSGLLSHGQHKQAIVERLYRAHLMDEAGVSGAFARALRELARTHRVGVERASAQDSTPRLSLVSVVAQAPSRTTPPHARERGFPPSDRAPAALASARSPGRAGLSSRSPPRSLTGLVQTLPSSERNEQEGEPAVPRRGHGDLWRSLTGAAHTSTPGFITAEQSAAALSQPQPLLLRSFSTLTSSRAHVSLPTPQEPAARPATPEPDGDMVVVHQHVADAAKRHVDHLPDDSEDDGEAEDEDAEYGSRATRMRSSAPPLDAYMPGFSTRGALPPLLDVSAVTPTVAHARSHSRPPVRSARGAAPVAAALQHPSHSYAAPPMPHGNGDAAPASGRVRAEHRRAPVTAATMFSAHRHRTLREGPDGAAAVEDVIFPSLLRTPRHDQ